MHATGDTDLQDVHKYYTNNTDMVRPHYLIGTDGNVHQYTREDRVAYHAGYHGEGKDNERVLYRGGWDVWSRRIKESPWIVSDPYPGYAWWRERWPGLESPTGKWVNEVQETPGLLAGEHPNGATVGIEVLSPKRRLPRVFTDEQYTTLRELVSEIAARHGFLADKDHVVGHEDLNPIRRCDMRGGWDPGLSRGFDWASVLAAP